MMTRWWSKENAIEQDNYMEEAYDGYLGVELLIPHGIK